ncbi:hypothetical protein Tco_0127148 [Tanacetum coccineum]
MLAPSGGGLILYQAYGNLYAITGIQCLEGHLEEIQRNLALWKKNNDKSTTYTNISRISTQRLETASQITRDAVTIHTKTASQDLKTASECTTQPII